MRAILEAVGVDDELLAPSRRIIQGSAPDRIKLPAGGSEPRMAVAVAVMGGAQQPEIVGLGAAAERIRHHVIDLQQMPGAAPAPTAPVHVAAAAPVALPHLPPHRHGNSAAADARPRRRGRRRGAGPMRHGLRAASCLRRRSGDSGRCRGPVRGLNLGWRSRRACRQLAPRRRRSLLRRRSLRRDFCGPGPGGHLVGFHIGSLEPQGICSD